MTIDILALARECGITADSPWGDEFMCTASSAAIAAFGNAIIERCANSCHRNAPAQGTNSDYEDGFDQAVDECAARIRAMKAPTP